jgi:hypothetical protein
MAYAISINEISEISVPYSGWLEKMCFYQYHLLIKCILYLLNIYRNVGNTMKMKRNEAENHRREEMKI